MLASLDELELELELLDDEELSSPIMNESADDELLEELEEELLELELLDEDSTQHSHSQLQLHLPEVLPQQLQLLEDELLELELLELLELDDEELLELDSLSEASDEELLDDELSSWTTLRIEATVAGSRLT